MADLPAARAFPETSTPRLPRRGPAALVRQRTEAVSGWVHCFDLGGSARSQLYEVTDPRATIRPSPPRSRSPRLGRPGATVTSVGEQPPDERILSVSELAEESYALCPFCRERVDPCALGVRYGVELHKLPRRGRYEYVDGLGGYFHPHCPMGLVGYAPGEAPKAA